MHGEHFADANYWKHEYTPTTINGIPDTVGDDLAITARYVCAAILGEKKGLPLLMGNEYAGRVVKGDDYGRHQAKIAGNPRGKVGDDDKTITEIIGELATMREHRDYTAKEIWNPFISALKERELEPEENETNSEWRKWTIYYDYKEGRKTITGGRFANVVYEARKHKKTR